MIRKYLPFLLLTALLACNNSPEKAGKEQDQKNITEKVTDPATEAMPAVPPANSDESGIEVQVSQDNPGSVTINTRESGQEQVKEEPLQGTMTAPNREVSFLFSKGTTAYNNDDYEAGIGYFNQIVEKDPENRKAFYNLGVGYFELNKFQDALRSFNKAISLNPRDSLAIQYRGRVYYMLGDFQKCFKDYDLVVKMKPGDYVSWYNRGTAKGQLKDYLGAIQDFDKAIELNPEYGEAYYNRGLANFYQGRRHEACYDWRKAYNLGHYQSEKALRSYCEDGE